MKRLFAALALAAAPIALAPAASAAPADDLAALLRDAWTYTLSQSRTPSEVA